MTAMRAQRQPLSTLRCRLSACLNAVLFECETYRQWRSDSVQRDHSDIVYVGNMAKKNRNR